MWTVEYPSGQLRVSQAFETWLGKALSTLEDLFLTLEPVSADRLRSWLDENEEFPEGGEVPLAFKNLHPALYVCQLEPIYYQGQMVSIQGQMTPILSMLQEQPISETHRIQTLYHQGIIGIVITDQLERIRDCNPVFCMMLGHEPSELMGQKIIDYIHPADRARQLTLYDQMRYGDAETVHVEKRYLRADGTFFWAEVAITLIRNAAGEISHFVRFLLDLSERKHLHPDISQRQGLIEDYFDSSPALMGMMELEEDDYRFVLTNPASEFYGAGRYSGLEGRSAREIGIAEETRQFMLSQIKACLSQQAIQRFIYEHQLDQKVFNRLSCCMIPETTNQTKGRVFYLIQPLS